MLDKETFSAILKHFSLQPTFGCIRLPINGPAVKIHVLEEGPSSCGPGHLDSALGPSLLPVPSCPSPPQGDQTGQGSEDQGYPGVPSVAFGRLVGLYDGDDDGATIEASTLQEDCEDPGQLSCEAIPGPSGGPTHFRQKFNLSRAQHDLDEEDLDFLSNHLASGTASGYGYSFRKFRLFCECFQADPLTCTSAVVVKYVRYLYEGGAKYSTVNGHRSAISKFHKRVHGIPMGEHPLVSQAVKAVFRLRPPLPQYRATFDIVPVLAYVRSLPTASIPLKLLSLSLS